MDLDKIVWTATVSGGSNPERTKSEMPGTDDRQIMVCSFSCCSLEQTHIYDIQSLGTFVCSAKSPPVYPSPERPDPGEHGDETVDHQHPGLVHTRAVGGQHHDPRDEHDQPEGQMFHTNDQPEWLQEPMPIRPARAHPVMKRDPPVKACHLAIPVPARCFSPSGLQQPILSEISFTRFLGTAKNICQWSLKTIS